MLLEKLRFQYVGFFRITLAKSRLSHDFFSTHVQFQDFLGPEK